MNEKLHVALTLDGTPSWFGYEKGVGHVVMSTVTNQGGDHIGGNATLAPVCAGSKPLECDRAKNGVAEKFQGDRKCKKCVAWLLTEGGESLLEDARNASYAYENADMIAELIAERSPERVAQVEQTAAQWDAVADAVADTPELAADKAQYQEIVAAIEAAESVSEPAVEAKPVKIADPTADEPWTPRDPESFFGTGMLINEAPFVQGRDTSGAPAARKTVKVPKHKGGGREIASRGVMADKNVNVHTDKIATDVDPVVGGIYGTKRQSEVDVMSRSAKRRYFGQITQRKAQAEGRALPKRRNK